MNHTYKVLKSDIELFAAALSHTAVGRGFDRYCGLWDGGAVEKITAESIKINGSYFFRNQFEFRVDVKKDSAGM
ncbi:hypothetical protein ACYCSE_15430 [Paenibacillus sp. SEL1]